jgi:hypothetical protein
MFASTIYPTGFQVRSRQKLTGLVDGFKNICERWSLNDLEIARLLHLEEEIGLCALILSGQVPPMTGDLKDRMALVIGISVGLGDLFDDNKNAEIRWLSSARDDLNGVNPIEYMLKGEFTNLKEVNELVEAARGLQ